MADVLDILEFDREINSSNDVINDNKRVSLKSSRLLSKILIKIINNFSQKRRSGRTSRSKDPKECTENYTLSCIPTKSTNQFI
jgi:hypothetical protein